MTEIGRIKDMPVHELVERYAATGVAQHEAELDSDMRKFRRLVDDIIAVEAELKARTGDARSALLDLYHHPNMQVRLNAARATLAIAPEAARAQLAAIRDSHWMPQAMHAGMSLRNLDKGIYRPS